MEWVQGPRLTVMEMADAFGDDSVYQKEAA